MNVEQILQMIDKVSASKITEFCLETPEGSLSLKKGPGIPLSVEQASSGKSSVLEEEYLRMLRGMRRHCICCIC